MSSGSAWKCVWLTVEPMNGCSVWQHRSLKSALWEGQGEKKSDWKWKTFPERQHSSTTSPALPVRLCSDWSSNYPAALRLGGSHVALMTVCPSLQGFQRRRGEIFTLERLKWLYSAPIYRQEKASFVGRVDMLYQTNKQSWRELLPRAVPEEKAPNEL